MERLYEAYGKEELDDLMDKLGAALLSTAGFIIIFNGDTKKITDIYHNVCKECVMKVVKITIEDYEKRGLFCQGKVRK